MPTATALPPILHDDALLLAFDKPSGLLVAPDRWDKARANLMGLVHARLGKHVANVHRLDADTSGVLLCTKDKTALDYVSGQFQSKTVAKVYHALCYVPPAEAAMKVGATRRDAAGRLPDAFTVEVALGEDEAQPGRMRVFRRRGGKAARTRFRTLAWFRDRQARDFAWVECHPETGRTHQLRVHLAAVGAPILHDPFYGVPDVALRLSDLKRGYKGRDEERPLLERLALHASALTVKHPATREPITITAPLPKAFAVALKQLARYAAAPAGGPPVLSARELAALVEAAEDEPAQPATLPPELPDEDAPGAS
jgi:23S rRNA pseudouridine1911/1915/1917 synthase